MTRIGIVGCAGRMGRMLLQAVVAADAAQLAGGCERPGSDAVGRDLGDFIDGRPNGLMIVDQARDLFDRVDVVIDFSTPEAAASNAGIAAETRTAYVVGTTGLSPVQEACLRSASASAALVWAPNMSVGVNILLAMVERAAALLAATDVDIEIIEMHHRHKVDAPSGTALALGKAAAAGRQVALEAVWRKSRDGKTGARPVGEIGFATLRGGDVVGDHTVIFAAEGERLEFTHKASSRQIFAQGAVRAALWVHGRTPGLYSMQDVLGF